MLKRSIGEADYYKRSKFAQSHCRSKTSFGKSLIFHAWKILTGKVSIIIVPLLGLADQTFERFL
jgi:hypothetical protein